MYAPAQCQINEYALTCAGHPKDQATWSRVMGYVEQARLTMSSVALLCRVRCTVWCAAFALV